MLQASGELILFVDADGATRFSDLDLLAEKIKSIDINGHGICIGSRAHVKTSNSVVKRSILRNFLMQAFKTVLFILGIRNIKDTQCGFKLFSREAARAVIPAMHVEGFIFDIEMLLIAQWCGIPIAEVGVSWHEVDGSKVNIVVDSIRMLKDLVMLRLCYLFGVWKAPRRFKK